MGAAPIPFTAIADYFRIYSLAEYLDFEEFAYIIRRMDSTLIELSEPKSVDGENDAAKHTGSKDNSNGRHKERIGAKGPGRQARRR